MTLVPPPSAHAGSDEGGLSRERALAMALIVVTAIVFYLCYRVAVPFLPAIAWALALAAIAHPLRRWVGRRVRNADLAAGISVILVALTIVAPVIFVTQHLVRQSETLLTTVQDELASGKWREPFEQRPRLRPLVRWFDRQWGLDSPPSRPPASRSHDDKTPDESSDDDLANGERPEARRSSDERPTRASARQPLPTTRAGSTALSPGLAAGADLLTGSLGAVVTGTIWTVMQLLITFLTLFFFFRDDQRLLAVLRSLLPLSNVETDELLVRMDDTIHATLYGSLVVALVQGGMGGLIFWWLGLPAPLLWGAVMAMLAVVPVLGTFIVWAPTALFLLLQGDWTRGLILAAWGAGAIGLIDNFLYPYLVGKRLRFHTLLVFFSLVGGLGLFGASGIILGPLLLAVADALLEIWRRRTSLGGTIEQGVTSSR